MPGTTLTVPAPHLAPPGLHDQLLLLVPSWLPGVSGLIPVLPALTDPRWADFSGAVTLPIGTIEELWGEGSDGGSHAVCNRALLPSFRLPRVRKKSFSGEDFFAQAMAQGLSAVESELRMDTGVSSGEGAGLQLSHGLAAQD